MPSLTARQGAKKEARERLLGVTPTKKTNFYKKSENDCAARYRREGMKKNEKMSEIAPKMTEEAVINTIVALVKLRDNGAHDDGGGRVAVCELAGEARVR